MKVSEITPGMKLRVHYPARNRKHYGTDVPVTILARVPGTRRFKVKWDESDYETEVEVRTLIPREYPHETRAREQREREAKNVCEGCAGMLTEADPGIFRHDKNLGDGINGTLLCKGCETKPVDSEEAR